MKQIYLEETLGYMFHVLNQKDEVQEIINNSTKKNIEKLTYFVLNE